MPQLVVPDFAPQLIWLAITFIALYLVMARFGLPRLGGVITARRQRIEGDIAKAAQMKAEADTVIAAYEKALAEARAAAQQTVRETTERLNAAAAERLQKLAQSLAAETKAAEGRILAAKQAALADLGAMAADIARAAAQKVAGAELDPARTRAAVDTLLRERA
jgi:F-type H+-transporting ATPase subunit b